MHLLLCMNHSLDNQAEYIHFFDEPTIALRRLSLSAFEEEMLHHFLAIEPNNFSFVSDNGSYGGFHGTWPMTSIPIF